MTVCNNCGAKNQATANFCQKCGKTIQQSATGANYRLIANSSLVGKICPYCQAPFKIGVEVVLCKDCGMPHHDECWVENGSRCTTFGCGASATPKAHQAVRRESSPLPVKEPVAVHTRESLSKPSPASMGTGEGRGTKAVPGLFIGAVIGLFASIMLDAIFRLNGAMGFVLACCVTIGAAAGILIGNRVRD